MKNKNIYYIKHNQKVIGSVVFTILSCIPVSLIEKFTPFDIKITSIGSEYGSCVMYGGIHNIGFLPLASTLDDATSQAITYIEKYYDFPRDYFALPSSKRRLL